MVPAMKPGSLGRINFDVRVQEVEVLVVVILDGDVQGVLAERQVDVAGGDCVLTERQVQVAADVSEVDVAASQLLESREWALYSYVRKGLDDGCNALCSGGHEKIFRFSGVKILSRSWLTHRN